AHDVRRMTPAERPPEYLESMADAPVLDDPALSEQEEALVLNYIAQTRARRERRRRQRRRVVGTLIVVSACLLTAGPFLVRGPPRAASGRSGRLACCRRAARVAAHIGGAGSRGLACCARDTAGRIDIGASTAFPLAGCAHAAGGHSTCGARARRALPAK